MCLFQFMIEYFHRRICSYSHIYNVPIHFYICFCIHMYIPIHYGILRVTIPIFGVAKHHFFGNETISFPDLGDVFNQNICATQKFVFYPSRCWYPQRFTCYSPVRSPKSFARKQFRKSVIFPGNQLEFPWP